MICVKDMPAYDKRDPKQNALMALIALNSDDLQEVVDSFNAFKNSRPYNKRVNLVITEHAPE